MLGNGILVSMDRRGDEQRTARLRIGLHAVLIKFQYTEYISANDR
jgi:hypothetical protein